MNNEKNTNIKDLKAKLSGKGASRFDTGEEATPERTDKVVSMPYSDGRFTDESAERAKQVIAQKKREDYRHERYKGKRTMKSWRIRDDVLVKLTQIEKLNEFSGSDFVTTEFIETALNKAFDSELKRLEKSCEPAIWDLVKKQIS